MLKGQRREKEKEGEEGGEEEGRKIRQAGSNKIKASEK